VKATSIRCDHLNAVSITKHIRLIRFLHWITHVYTARMDYAKFQNRNQPMRSSETESSTRKYLLFTVLF
jgi:hypothetical protein